MTSTMKQLEEMFLPKEVRPSVEADWRVRAVMSGECLSYVAWNTRTREALVVDPKLDDLEAYHSIARELTGYLWMAVVDTHTHADHISCAARLAGELKAPLVMHQHSPSTKVNVRVGHSAVIAAHAGPIQIFHTPGHTMDSMSLLWGPYFFGGDTILYGDVGRDDLPGGDPEAHYVSAQRLKELIPPEAVVLPGHDHKGGRASSWRTQLSVNASLKQGHDDFVREASEFDGPAPALLKKALAENFR